MSDPLSPLASTPPLLGAGVPPLPPQLRRIKRIEPIQMGYVMAMVFGLMSLTFIPVYYVLAALLRAPLSSGQRIGVVGLGVAFAIVIPVIYAGIGFVAGVFGAWSYNFSAKWIGGIEVEVE